MKKLLIIVIILGIIYLIPNTSQTVVIPSEAIRFRVIANSDSTNDQNLKMDVKNSLNNELNNILNKSDSIEESRNLIKNNYNKIEKNVATTLFNNNSNQKFQINYGMNYFPEKEFKGVKYEEGEYESLVVTLGEGKGENWWCVLFPPLCLLEAEENETNDVEYKFFVSEIIDKFSK